MYWKFAILFSFFISSSSANTLLELEALSTKPLYFNIPVSEYRIQTAQKCQKGVNCPVNLEVIFEDRDTAVITDRPMREKSRVELEDFIAYATAPKKSGLVFTLNIRQSGEVLPVNFSLRKVSYDKASNTLSASTELNIEDDKLVNTLNTTGKIVGEVATLSVEG